MCIRDSSRGQHGEPRRARRSGSTDAPPPQSLNGQKRDRWPGGRSMRRSAQHISRLYPPPAALEENRKLPYRASRLPAAGQRPKNIWQSQERPCRTHLHQCTDGHPTAAQRLPSGARNRGTWAAPQQEEAGAEWHERA
eukprot:1727483-Pyramimonas_sp.AAC.2